MNVERKPNFCRAAASMLELPYPKYIAGQIERRPLCKATFDLQRTNALLQCPNGLC